MPETNTTTTSEDLKPTKRVQKTHYKKYIKLGVFVFVVALFLYLVTTITNFVSATSRIVAVNQTQSCLASKFCIQIDGTFANNWATWKISDSFPPFFSITASGFTNNQKVQIVCPTTLEEKEDSIWVKLQFIFNNPDIQKCRVTKL